MKFSVLLPTRNGGKYLKSCIESVLSQDYKDMELIVFDNANTDNTAEVVNSYSSDKRLKYFRTDSVVSVTDNWNNALKKSSGDYVLMMGDDDFLLPGYFDTLDQTIKENDFPDGISYFGYSFIYPDALENKEGYYSDPHYNYEKKLIDSGKTTKNQLKSIVYDMFKFKNRVPLNTLPHIWSRKVINRVDGELFRPPYPDHFALNAIFLKANTWVFSKKKLYIIGVTPKSYGHYVFSDNEQKGGEDYLGISGDFPGQLPGSALINNMYVWLQLLKDNYPDYLGGVQISRNGYVRHQLHYWISQYRHGSIERKDLFHLLGLLTFKDKLGLISAIWDKRSILALYAMFKTLNPSKIDTFYYGPQQVKGILTSSDLYNKVIRKKIL
jgi:glycosyltransferase involved in cell wall biosynthesis